MDSQQPQNSSKRSSTPFEYFLYTAIIVETGLAALVYKAIFRNPDLARLNVYFAVFYFAFLAWAIAQLNLLHRDRNSKLAQMEPPPADSAPIEPTAQEAPLAEVAREDTPPLLGLTGPQLVIVVVVFATAVATFTWALRLLN
jgi:hypothetical protein